MKRRTIIVLLSLTLLLSGEPAEACSVCFGAPGSDLSESMSKAILFLLAVLSVVLAGITIFVLNLWHRSKRLTHLNAQA